MPKPQPEPRRTVAAPAKRSRPAPLKVDAERYPHVERNPGLERALRIQQELAKGKPRDEAVRLADAAMGPRSPVKAELAVPPADREAAAKPARKRRR
jgi:hypothetical protein